MAAPARAPAAPPHAARAARGAVPPPRADVDERLILRGVSWRDYCVLRDLLDGPGVRMTKRGLGVREVWIWVERRITVHVLGAEG
jgi:hypothetical protein